MTLLLVIIALALGLITYNNPKNGLLVLVASLPAYLLRTELLGVPTTLLELMGLVFLLAWLLRVRKLPFRDLNNFFGLSLLLIVAAATLSVFVAPNVMAALGVWKAFFIEPILLMLVIREMIFTKQVRVKELFLALGVSALVISLVGVIQWITGMGIPVPWDIERRITSLFDYPNAVGLFLGPIIVIGTLSVVITKGWERIFWISASTLSLIAVIAAQSEAALVALVATFIIAGLTHNKTRIASLAATTILILITTLTPALFQKLTLHDYSGEVRRSQWTETAELLKNHWLLGAGLSGYPTALAPYHEATEYEIFQYPHNILLNIWVELGLLGVVAFGLLGFILIQTARQKPSRAQIIALFVLLEMTIHGLVDVPYFKNDLSLLTWLMIAITLSTYARPKTR